MKRITADTTEGQIFGQIEEAKAALSRVVEKALTEDVLAGEKLVRAAQEVRNAEALAVVQFRYARLVAGGAATSGRLKYLFDAGTHSDDTWSGRGNDSTRAAQDVVRDWATREIEDVMWDSTHTT